MINLKNESESIKPLHISGDLRKTKTFYDKAISGELTKYSDIEPNEFAKQLDQIITVCNDKLGNNWDFHIETNLEEVWYAINVLVYYPEITITNSEHNTHLIKDLIVAIPISVFEGRLIFGPPSCTRGTISVAEYFCGYVHSHANKQDYLNINSLFKTQDFCLGDGTSSMNIVVTSFYEEKDFDPLLFEIYLYELDGYVEWESLVGVPYLRMKKIGRGGLSNTNILQKNYSNTFFKPIIETLLHASRTAGNKNFDYVLKDNLPVIQSNEKFSNYVKNLVLTYLSIENIQKVLYIVNLIDPNIWESIPDGIIRIQDNSIYNISAINSSFTNSLYPEIPHIYIQDKKIEFSVYNELEEVEEDVDIEEVTTTVHIHPQFLNELKEQYERQLQRRILERNLIRKTYSIAH